MKHLVTSALMLLALLSYSNANEILFPGEIKGDVTCQSSGQLLEYATVSLMAQSDSSNTDNVITDAKGEFLFKDVPEGTYYIVVQFMGYEKKIIRDIVVNKGKSSVDLGKLEMNMSVVDLGEYQVTGERNAVSFGIDKKVIDVGKELAAQGGTAVDALQNAPSVQVDAEGNVLLRGSSDFTLLVNGKPSLLDANQVLQQTQAETIERIEIITNPSVKYEAKGTSGIINLVLKNQRANSTEGLVNLSLANGDKYSGSLMLNKKVNKFSGFAGISYSNKSQRTENWGYRDVFSSDSTYHETIDAKRKIQRLSYDLKFGADYSINSGNVIAFSAQIGNWQFNRNIAGLYSNNNLQFPELVSDITTDEEFGLKNDFMSGDISYSHDFNNKDGHKLELVAFFGDIKNSTADDYGALDSSFFQQIRNNYDRSQMRYKTDYTLPLKNDMQFEAGLFTDLHTAAYNYSFSYQQDGGENQSGDFTIAELFDYDNSVYAAYSSLSGKIKKLFDYQVGIRVENYQYSYQTGESAIENDYTVTNLFPSVHLSRDIGENQRLGLSYSRRVNRPDSWQLCPFVYSSDSYVTKRGNPDLQQELIDSYELSYLLMVGKFNINTELFHRKTDSPIGSFLLEEDGHFVETYENLDREMNSGIELMGSYKPLDWLQLGLTVNGYRWEWEGMLSDNNYESGRSMRWNGNFKTTVTIRKNTLVQFLAIYYAPNKIPQGEADAFYYFDFILRHSFFNKKLTLGLRTHNTFDSGLYHYTSSGDNFSGEDWYRYEGPVFIFSLSYKLNNFKQKQPKENISMDFDSGLDQ